MYRCGCDMDYKIYIPKRSLGIIGTQVVDWQAVDVWKDADVEIEDVQHLAKMSRRSFIDGRITERLICSVCSSQIISPNTFAPNSLPS